MLSQLGSPHFMRISQAIRSLLRPSICALLACVSSHSALAGAFQVDPVRIEITAERKIASVRVRNDGTEEVTIHARPFSWVQRDGTDVYERTDDVIVSPPVATIPPGGEQLIRMGLRAPASGGTYRLIIEEVPDAQSRSGVQVTLRLNLPVLAMQRSGSAEDLHWRSWPDAEGNWVIEASNTRDGVIRIEPAEVASATGLTETEALRGTILPNGSRRWTLTADPAVTDYAKFAALRKKSDALAAATVR